jgi:hypothetical protein
MTRWIIAIAVGVLMLCEMLFNVPSLFAQSTGGPFDQLSPGNQKAARALFEAQRSDLPPGTRPLTLDEIAARKQSGQGWGRVFDGMKSRGLVDAKNFGQTISSYNHRHHSASASPITTAANRTIAARRDVGGKVSQGDHDKRVSVGSAPSKSPGAGAVSTTHEQGRASAALAGAQIHRGGQGAGGAGHGRSK